MSKKTIPFSLTLPEGGRYVTRNGKYPTSWHYFQDAKYYPFVAIIDGKPLGFTSEGKYFNSLQNSELDLFIEIEEPEPDVCYINIYRGKTYGELIKSIFFRNIEDAKSAATDERRFRFLGTYKINLKDKI